MYSGEMWDSSREAFLAMRARRTSGEAWLGVVEIGEKGIVLAIVDAAGMEAFGEDLGESGFTHAQRAFDDDEAGSLRTSLRSASALGCGRVVGRHRWGRRPDRAGAPMVAIIAESILEGEVEAMRSGGEDVELGSSRQEIWACKGARQSGRAVP